MRSEMGYRFKGAGHEEPEGKRKYVPPSQKLKQAFENWLRTADDSVYDDHNTYHKEDVARKVTEFIIGMVKSKPTIEELHSLLYHYQDHANIKRTGAFLTTLYNRAEDKIIVFDVDIGKKIKELGWNLAKGKILVNKMPVGHDLGSDSKGIVINYADAGDMAGAGLYDTGVLINYGKISTNNIASPGNSSEGLWVNAGEVSNLGDRELNGPIINFGKADNIGNDAYDESTIINAGECEALGDKTGGRVLMIKKPAKDADLSSARLVLDERRCAENPALVKYINNLRNRVEAGRTDYKEAINLVKRLTRKKIEKDLERILGDEWC